VRSNKSVINIYKAKNTKSEVVTQLLYGDTFKKLKEIGSWIRIKNDTDNYKGYIKNKNLLQIKKILIKFIDCMLIYTSNRVLKIK